MLSRRSATAKDIEDWDKELEAWGLKEPIEDHADDELIPLWEENWPVIEWWLSVPNFLSFNNMQCTGMNVLAVKADLELSGRESTPELYARLKVVARTLTEELNARE